MSGFLSSFADYEEYRDFQDDYNADRIADARQEAAEEKFDQVAWTCRDCGERWDPGRHSATRIEPAWVEREECPACGGPPEEA